MYVFEFFYVYVCVRLILILYVFFQSTRHAYLHVLPLAWVLNRDPFSSNIVPTVSLRFNDFKSSTSLFIIA